MPKGYPETITCPNCKEGLPAEYSYCPCCGQSLVKKEPKTHRISFTVQAKARKGEPKPKRKRISFLSRR